MAFEQEEWFALESVVSEHHAYEQIWILYIGEQLNLRTDVRNEHNSCAVSMIRGDEVIGPVPRQLSRAVWHFFTHGGQGFCEVMGRRKCGPSLEAPCTNTFT